jgi:shikimate dehydrogenase
MNPEDAPFTLCGSLSRHPVSLGAVMHRAGYAALGLRYAYVPFAVTDLPGALQGMRALGIRGFGVSMPFKREVLSLLDALDPLAARIGAVNTIVNDRGRLTGYNTDAHGALAALAEVAPVRAGTRVLLLGAGGAARAVAHALRDAGAAVHLANRSEANAHALADPLGLPVVPYGALSDLGAWEVLVNASAAGMTEYGALPPALLSALGPGLVVLDLVYKPVQTTLLARAAAAGARTVHGGRMLLHQACRQFELYTQHTAPMEAMDRALTERLGTSGVAQLP